MLNKPLLAATFALLFTSSSLGAASSDAPWKTLFNSENLDGWHIIDQGGKAWVEDKEIKCHMVSNTKEHTFVATNQEYADFILEAESKVDGIFHTGYLFRCIDAPEDAKVRIYGYQVKLDPTPRAWSGGIFDDFGKSWNWLHDLSDNEAARNAYKREEWNHFRIEAIGNVMKVWVNGVPATHLQHDKYTKGIIALKIHSLGDYPERESILAHFRNIRIIDTDVAKYAREMDIPLKVVVD